MSLDPEEVLYAPPYVQLEQGGIHLLIDPAAPNWMATDRRGAEIIDRLRGGRGAGELPVTFRLISEYAAREGVEPAKAWLHVHSFLREVRRCGFVGEKPFAHSPYPGRGELLRPALRELWVHLNDACNLACIHCLVSSSPMGNRGLPTQQIERVVDQAVELGAARVCFTGGEPLLRHDLPELAQHVTEKRGRELVILTNGTLLHGERWDQMRALSPERLFLQISLDGSRPQVNDPIRGEGSFERIVRGIESALAVGFSPTVTTAVSEANLEDLPAIVELLADLGVRHYHLLWMHRRGRALTSDDGLFPATGPMIAAVRRLRRRAEDLGVEVDNFTAWRARLDAPRGTRFDLGSAGVETLCLHSDGCVYPSAVLAGIEELRCGDVARDSLKRIWREGELLRQLRWATVLQKRRCADCEYRFLCGGGDIEHSYLYLRALSGSGGSILGPDPYCELHQALIEDTLFELAREGREAINGHAGFDAPLVYRAMGGEGVGCEADVTQVRTVPSLCVLSSRYDRPHQLVRDFYAHAAQEPQEGLCCPTGYPAEEVDHIPPQVLERAYGCSSPVTLAQVQPGEVVVDLGSGAGIDCFIAARKVGPKGWVIGVDMTPQMLRVAWESSPLVARNLGYEVVEFREGFLEEIPIQEESVDLVISNCVINLSPDKGRVFHEMWRILRPGGRFVISDVVAEREVPSHLRASPRLWGECIGGALVEEQLYAHLERAGFSGLQTLRRTFWREVEGARFLSVTVRGHKFEKSDGCVYRGQQAIYHGPFKAVVDEEGHLFPRGESVEVCTDMARKLRSAAYRDFFTLLEPDGEVEPYACCAEAEACC